MSRLNRIVLIRHGETTGESSIRFHGRTDVALSHLGRSQARAAARSVPGDGYELVVASPLSRAWRTALIAFPGCWVRLEPGFREIDFGVWEGLTREEIAERDPVLYEEWQERGPGFDFPGGEPRCDFRARVQRGLDGLLAGEAKSAIVVAHKGVVRVIVEALTGVVLDGPEPELGKVLYASRTPGGDFVIGGRSSDPRAVGGR